MASVSSITFSSGGVDLSVGAAHRIFSGRGYVNCFHSFTEAGSLGHRGSQAKRELKGGPESFSRQRKAVWCMAQRTGSPVLEFDEETGSSVMLSNLNAAPNLLKQPNDCEDSSAVLKSAEAGLSPSQAVPQRRVSIASLMEPVVEDLRILNENLHSIVGAENPLLMAAAEQIFSAGGKRMRPALVLLVSRATAQLGGLEDLTPRHRRLAEVIEMIHTASLIHDDVLDESDVRRGKKTIHQLYGTRVAVLAGDFMFAQSSWYLASLENIEVIKLISQVIKDLASGEIKQASSLFDCDTSLQDYLEKSYYKTASLIAASTKSAAIFSGVSPSICDQMFEYGRNLGLAFQIVDDILDFTQSTEQLGKPAGSDLAKGNLTAPVLFALEEESELRHLIDSEFTDEDSLAAAIKLIHKGGGIEKARVLAKQKGDEARKTLACLPQGVTRCSLEGMVNYVLERIC